VTVYDDEALKACFRSNREAGIFFFIVYLFLLAVRQKARLFSSPQRRATVQYLYEPETYFL